MPFKLGPLEIVVILVIVLMVFGVGKLPQIASSIGKSLKSFREGQQGEPEETATEEAAVQPKKRRKKAASRVKAGTATKAEKAGSEEITAG
jgi:sec-independent protein translocase protein TatA